MQYFKKEGPNTPIIRANGDAIKFPTLDGHFGYHATEDAGEIADCERCIREHRGGISKIDEAEYENDFAKKKPLSKPLPMRFREEFGGGPLGDTASSPHPSAPSGPVAAAPEPTVVSVSAPAPPQKPRVGKRHIA